MNKNIVIYLIIQILIYEISSLFLIISEVTRQCFMANIIDLQLVEFAISQEKMVMEHSHYRLVPLLIIKV